MKHKRSHSETKETLSLSSKLIFPRFFDFLRRRSCFLYFSLCFVPRAPWGQISFVSENLFACALSFFSLGRSHELLMRGG